MGDCQERGPWLQRFLPSGAREWYMTKGGVTLVNAMHIAASVFINDKESDLHHDYEGGSTASLTAGGGNGCWSRSSGSSRHLSAKDSLPSPVVSQLDFCSLTNYNMTTFSRGDGHVTGYRRYSRAQGALE